MHKQCALLGEQNWHGVRALSCVLFIENQKDTLANGYPWPKSRGENFFMEQKLRFGLKKNWANYEQLLRAVVSCFHGDFFFF